MSGWGTKIFDNDLALDVKNDFHDLLGLGMKIEEIEDYILKYKPLMEDEDCCAFWSALAKIEWDYGLLQEKTKDNAKYVINHFSDAHLYIEEKDQKRREKELKNLYLQLETVNEKPKRRKKTFVYRTTWKEGDIFAYPIDDKYIYIHIIEIKRKEHKIEQLVEDEVFIRIFDRLSHKLLSIKYFKTYIRKKYKVIESLGFISGRRAQKLWCIGKREKECFEKKLCYIGNKKVRLQYSDLKTVCWDYKYSEFEKFLKKEFELESIE